LKQSANHVGFTRLELRVWQFGEKVREWERCRRYECDPLDEPSCDGVATGRGSRGICAEHARFWCSWRFDNPRRSIYFRVARHVAQHSTGKDSTS